MGSFWGKMGVFAVIVVALVAAVKFYPGKSSEPKEKPKTFYDVIQEDDKRLRADPVPPVATNKPPVEAVNLSPEDEVQAQRLFEMAITQRKMGRLPGVTFKLMVDYCREIITSYPDSSYALKSQAMLREIPPRHQKMYKVTEEEMGLK